MQSIAPLCERVSPSSTEVLRARETDADNEEAIPSEKTKERRKKRGSYTGVWISQC